MSSNTQSRSVVGKDDRCAKETAHVYDTAGSRYLQYADGDHADLFAFKGSYSFADREIWSRLDAILVDLRSSGRDAIRILDAGCGPGTWLLRLALRARDLGFTDIKARGFDISAEMIALAHHRLGLAGDPHIGVRFEIGDVVDALEDQDDGSYDLTICLYGVLNHLDGRQRVRAAKALARVTDGDLLVSVRTVGSQPSIYFTGVSDARSFHQDNEADRLDIDLADGRHIAFSSHLFTADELRSLFEGLAIDELVGLDLFHGRFAPDPRWNPANLGEVGLREGLERLERLCAHDPAFINRAAHALLHARTC